MNSRRDILRLLKLEENGRDHARGFKGQERSERNRLWIECVPRELRWLAKTQNIREFEDLPTEEHEDIEIWGRIARLWLTRPRDTSSLLPPLGSEVAEFVNEIFADPTRPPVSPVYDVWGDEIGSSEIVGEISRWDEICMYYGPAASEAAIKKALKDRLGKNGRRPRKDEIAPREAMKAYLPSRHRPKDTVRQDRNQYWFAIGERLIEEGWSKLAANRFIRLYVDTRASEAAIQKVLDTLPWPNILVE